MAISGFNTSITQLTGSDTFYSWFNKENEDIIAKLNLAKVADVTGGDGVLASLNATSGLVTLSIGGTSGTITKGLSFSGPISFLGEAIVPNISYKITGLTSGNTGYTFGSVIRITPSGYTKAKADDPESAEVVGILSARNSAYSVVTLAGKIDGDFNDVAGSTLTAGCVYFLSGQTAGNVTVVEPTTIGYVSKPVLVGLGATSGVVIQYRGNYLNSSTFNGESGSNRLLISLPTSPTDPRTQGFSAGSFLSYAPNVITGNTFFAGYLTDTGRTSIDGWFLSGSKNYAYSLYDSGTEYLNIPREEDFIVGMIETVTLSGGNVIYQVLTKGTSTTIPRALRAGNAKGIWLIAGETYAVSASGITQLDQQPLTVNSPYISGYQVGIAFQDTPTYWFINPRPLTEAPNITSLKASGSFTSGTSDKNYAFNGDFEIWQRSTGKTEYTTSGNVYFADAWIRRQSNTGSGSGVQSIERKQFNVESTEVEGNPKYYVDIKCVADHTGTTPTGQYSIGHIVEGINSFNGESVTVSFYAKCASSGIGGLSEYPVNVYFARYSNGSLIEKKVIGEVDISNTSWEKFTLNYTVPSLAASTYTNDYVEIGIDILPTVKDAYDADVSTSSNLKFSVASFAIYKGNISSPSHAYDLYTDKLEKCQRFYFSTYSDTQTIGSVTKLSEYEPVINTYNFTYLPQMPFSVFKFPSRMRSTPTITLYSPYSGISNEVYNFTAQKDLRNANGTKGYNNQIRYAPASVSTNNTSQDETSIKINLVHGVVPYDVLYCHIIADASYTL